MRHVDLNQEALARYLSDTTPWSPDRTILPNGQLVQTKVLMDTDDLILLHELFGFSSGFTSAILELRDLYASSASKTSETIQNALNRS